MKGIIAFIRIKTRPLRNSLITLISNISRLSFFKTVWFNYNILNSYSNFKVKIYKKSYIRFAKTASFHFSENSSLQLGNIPKYYIYLPTLLKVSDNSKISVLGNFKIFTGCKIIIMNGGKLELGSGYINVNSKIICSNLIKIGYNVAISDDVVIRDSDLHTLNYEGYQMSKPIIIEDHVWIGERAVILKGVKLGKNSIVAAGSMVTKDVPENTIVAGNPARIIRENINWM
jgi:acetyltransferase-like isoleucine patch superfamily enzyme